ncbi:PQQ-dependent sugar dehydrogenase [Seohaeicola zhoushanensis]|uniref:Cytochrome c domain-containing protein n=1 Tax=Seohaeicola zhoushanensis TaxID=1569283 RepID=A0A8J3H0Z3_9RHOB|nr:PQQ-dependent sugar dehydrogenase [Seohaeicola zhoushanensis]GHF63116.1 hypothetical protein GCM10017056_37970 [Seohaeicola zhoushanensis]
MRRFSVLFSALATLILGLVGGAYLATHHSEPIAAFYNKVAKKTGRLLGMEAEKENTVGYIESTFLRFATKLYRLPDTNWKKGGGLTVMGDTLLLIIQDGRIYRFEDGKGLIQTGIEVPDNGFADYVDLVKQPEFSNQVHKPDSMRYNDILYVDSDASGFRGLIISYTFFDREKRCHGSRLAKLPFDGIPDLKSFAAAAADWDVFFETTPCLPFRLQGTALEGIQAGGRMALHPDGRLIFASGDYAHDGIETPDIGLMDPAVLYGKVISIVIPTGEFRVLSVGHRNLQGVTVDTKGEIWTVEHGVRGGDELNHIREGLNYGWPKESLGTLYTGQPLPFDGPPGRHDTYTRPAFAWLPSAATSALTTIDNFDPTWDGDLLAGALSSPEYGQSLYHIRTDGDSVVFVERIELERRVRYVTQFGKRIALWLDLTDLMILTPVEREDPLGRAIDALAEAYDADVVASTKGLLQACSECHSFMPAQSAAGPTLNGVVGRKVAGTAFEGYSEALSNAGGTWEEDRLKAFVSDPQSIAPGTPMPAIPVQDPRVLDALVFTLRHADTSADEHLKY